MKKLFAVVLYQPNSEVEERITTLYPRHFKYTDGVFLIAVDSSVLSRKIATELGIGGQSKRIEDASGAVFKLNSSYSGYTTRSLWEWLSSVFEET